MGTVRPLLITMPQSHYSEKARWAMDRLVGDYEEDVHVPGLHRIATARHGGRSVPVLVHEGQQLADSTAILKHLDAWRGGGLLYPRAATARAEVEALEAQFNDVLGPAVRVWGYAQTMNDASTMRRMVCEGTPWFEGAFWWLGGRAITRLIARSLKVTKANADTALEEVKQVFARVSSRLTDGRRYLVAGQFSAADLTFAALAAPVLLPPQCRASYASLEDSPAAMQTVVATFRNTPAGRYAMALYADERNKRV